jgi:membrane fusion protein, adhesin transport system
MPLTASQGLAMQHSLQTSLMRDVETPDRLRLWIRRMAWLLLVLPALFMFLPWQQNVTALGKVTAYSPSERVQTIDAPVSGLINRWHVQEGTLVKEGDLLLEISDTDPNFKQRLEAQRDNLQSKFTAKQDELSAYELQKQSLTSARDAKISAAQYKLDVANQKIRSSQEAVNSAQATLDAASLQVARLQRLFGDGLVSKRDLEVAERDHIIASRNLSAAQAQWQSAKAETSSAAADIQQIRSDTQAYLDSTSATINKIKGEMADSENSLHSSEISLARQNMQKILAPRDGTIFRLPVNSQSQIIKQGDPLLVIVPHTTQRAVELWVDGRDAPLITQKSVVRLEFEGWPAIQVPGWAQVGVGTFEGEISFVDPTDNGGGHFRIMVVHKPGSPEWPTPRFLRQGISAKGWVLLDRVTIGYEIWRLLNGFPPRIPHEQSPLNTGAGKPA